LSAIWRSLFIDSFSKNKKGSLSCPLLYAGFAD